MNYSDLVKAAMNTDERAKKFIGRLKEKFCQDAVMCPVTQAQLEQLLAQEFDEERAAGYEIGLKDYPKIIDEQRDESDVHARRFQVLNELDNKYAYIAAICRNRWTLNGHWYNEHKVIAVVRVFNVEHGVPIDSIEAIAKRSRNWSTFIERLQQMCEDAQRA